MKNYNNDPIAIVGMSCRFPGGGDSPEAFWELLSNKQDAITEISDDRWSTPYFYSPNRDAPGKTYTKRAGQLENIYHFEPEFFGLSPREAIQMDPQQRLLLEMAWEALESGGQLPENLSGSDCSVFIGISSLDYANARTDDPSLVESHFMTGNTLSIAANRISHFFNLKGGSVAIDTACSSSLVALHQACLSIWSGEASASIAGAAHLLFNPFPFIGFSKASMLSPDGKCRAFSADANGYVRSEGGAVFFLKPLAQAQADGDPVQAVILATGINTDGGDKALTVPDGKMQQLLLEKVYATAGIRPDQISYIEAHGTGTKIGDPVEAGSIGNAIGTKRDITNPVLIGSVKSNIGHLEPASGAAGLMKVILSLQHRNVPASLHLENVNPDINFSALNIKLAKEHTSLDENDMPLIMGVNSFGFGGSNAHAVISEYVSQEKIYSSELLKEIPPLYLSANTPDSLKGKARQFQELLMDENFDSSVYDIFYTAAYQRHRQKHGLIAHGDSINEIAKALGNYSEGNKSNNITSAERLKDNTKKTAFVFSGNGSQWSGMGKELISNSIFKKSISEIDLIFAPLAGWSLQDELLANDEDSRLDFTEFAQPLLFAVQIGIVDLLKSYGVKVDVVLGHSVGEVAAAYVSGMIDLEQAVKIIYFRSEAQAKTRGKGKMAAAHIAYDSAVSLIDDIGLDIEIAASNSPESVTFTGAETVIKELVSVLEEEHIFCKILDLDYAFHSKSMDGVKNKFLDNLGVVNVLPSETSFISTVTGNTVDHSALDSQYWWKNLRNPVQFDKAIDSAIDNAVGVFIEIGPHQVLNTYINECLRHRKIQGAYIPTLKRNVHEQLDLIEQAVFKGVLFSNSHSLDYYFQTKGNIVTLPTYPWDRQEYVFSSTHEGINRVLDHPLLGFKLNNTEGIWTNQIDLHNFKYLSDHIVAGTIVFPAAAFIEMALAASSQYFEHTSYEINSFEIRSPMALEENQIKDLQFILNEEDLSFKIISRDRFASQAWHTHVVGKFVSDTDIKDRSIDIQTILTNRDSYLEGEDVYRIASNIGLEYGSLFRGVESVSIRKQQLVSCLKISDEDIIEQGKYILSPRLLDSAFHTLFPILPDKQNERFGPFLPVFFGDIRLYRKTDAIKYCLCEVISQSARSISVRFLLLDKHGGIIVQLENCLFKQLALTRDEKHTEFYGLTQIPKNHIDPVAVSPVPSIENLAKEIASSLGSTSVLEREKLFNHEILPLYDALAISISEEAFKHLGAYVDEFTIDGLILKSGIDSSHQYLISYMCKILEQDERANCDDGMWRLKEPVDSIDSRSIWRSLAIDHPGYINDMILTSQNAFNIVNVLAGKVNVETPGKSLKLVGNRRAQHDITPDILYEAIEQIKASWPKNNRRLRVAEFIDNTTCLSKQIIEQIPKEFCDYQYLAVNEEICIYANQLYKHCVNISAETIDFSSEDLSQNFRHGEFDIVIVSNLLHKQSNLKSKLSILESLLASGGLLFIAESRSNNLLNINMGINPQWWMRSSDVEHPASSLMTPEDCHKLLMDGEFCESVLLSDRISSESHHYVISAKRNVRTEKNDLNPDASSDCWVIVSGHGDYTSSIAEAIKMDLSTKGIQSYIYARDIEDRKENSYEKYFDLFTKLGNEQIFTKQVIYLGGIELEHEFSNIKHQTDSYSACCADVSRLLESVQSCFTESKPRLWLIANHAMDLHPDFSSGQSTPANPSQAVLWGLGRVIKNEYPDIDFHLLDIQNSSSVRRFADTIINEIIHVDDETEIIMVEGTRYVNRIENIQVTEEADWTRHSSLEETKISLTTGTNNKLDTLVWKRESRNKLNYDEVEISVEITGLNFRDVMYASGMLSDEILQNGFAGATLGLECTGIVTSIGSGVSEFTTGDKVIAFAPSSFSSHIITKESAVFPMPVHWSFEEAATIPTAFLTVYYSLHYLARLREGERLLVHGAAGGVGLAAIQYARYCGAEIFATAGSKEKQSYLRDLGVDHVMNSRDLTFADEVMEITEGEGVDIILNSIAGEAVDKNLSILKPFGRFVELGKRDFLLNRKMGVRPFRNNITYFGVDIDQLMSWQPELSSELFKEMMLLFSQGSLRPLPYTVFPACDVTTAFRFMQESGHIGKVVVSMQKELGSIQQEAKPGQDLHIDEQSTYLVTGGVSGFGFATVQWLIEKGSKNLVLLSRQGLKDVETQREVENYRENGINIYVEKCDVADPISLKRVLRNIDQHMPPLKGVIHAAMVLDDRAIKNITEESFERVFKPKIQGAWNLHELTSESSLDFFIMYSSATTYVGNPGQANYVAANSYLEALARYRKKLDLPALAIAWDAIIDKGYLARNPSTRETMQKRLGINGLSSREAFHHLAKAFSIGKSDIAVINANWPAMKRLLPITALPIYEEIMHGISDYDVRKEGQDITEMIYGLSREEVYVLVGQLLIEEIANILHLSAERIDHNNSLQDLGIDSLMAMELLTAIESRFGVEISVMALSDSSTVDSLTARLVKGLIDTDNTKETVSGSEIDSDSLVYSLARSHAEELSDSDVDQIIQEYEDSKR